jgi:hypothetical protein
MQAIFQISDLVDDAGVSTYKAMLLKDFDAGGIPDPSAPAGYGETVWEAIAMLCELVADCDPYDVLYMGEEAL